MKTMQNFAAQQLTKKQMNDVKGGEKAVYKCDFMCNLDDGSQMTYVYADSAQAATESLLNRDPKLLDVICIKVS